MFPGTDTWSRGETERPNINSDQHNPRSGFKTGEPSIENRRNNYKRLCPLPRLSLLVVQVQIIIFSSQSRTTKYAGGGKYAVLVSSLTEHYQLSSPRLFILYCISSLSSNIYCLLYTRYHQTSTKYEVC